MEEKNNVVNFGLFASQRIIVGILLIIAVLLILFSILKFFDKSLETKMTDAHDTDTPLHVADTQRAEMPAKDSHVTKSETTAHLETESESAPYLEKTIALTLGESKPPTKSHIGDTAPQQAPSPTHAADNHTLETHATAKDPATADKTGHAAAKETEHAASEETGIAATQETGHATAEETAHGTPAEGNGHGLGLGFPVSDIPGVTFVRAAITPLNHELNERFWGWRPNDVTNVTDNVKNFQLGVLEVTRRTAVVLSERLSRTGITAALDDNLESATNWLMIKPNRYIFPSAEAKYNDSIDAIKLYIERLENKTAKFYTRSDNLLPLLSSYVELLGSCDENLAKMTEEDGSPVSYFKADDYFYYAQGVATSLHTILQAIAHDFRGTIGTRLGNELMHHAIVSCHHAMQIDPVIILESNLSSIFANHRANMAAPISHAGFYLRVLITTLST